MTEPLKPFSTAPIQCDTPSLPSTLSRLDHRHAAIPEPACTGQRNASLPHTLNRLEHGHD